MKNETKSLEKWKKRTKKEKEPARKKEEGTAADYFPFLSLLSDFSIAHRFLFLPVFFPLFSSLHFLVFYRVLLYFKTSTQWHPTSSPLSLSLFMKIMNLAPFFPIPRIFQFTKIPQSKSFSGAFLKKKERKKVVVAKVESIGLHGSENKWFYKENQK